ncbi:hypothetical protein F2Q69_00052203 [Brassica cretica]|uniref:Uncharacterized protein n=1 Tax=Brassica cretica TaxID=69181 RepID=A0A8S9N5W2_BRACR|nr:hypothetical protein F2Q69_00052203 [Brassica cretica]
MKLEVKPGAEHQLFRAKHVTEVTLARLLLGALVGDNLLGSVHKLKIGVMKTTEKLCEGLGAREKSFKLLRSLFCLRRARWDSFKSARPSRLESERILRRLVSVVLSVVPSKRETSSFPRRIHAIGC